MRPPTHTLAPVRSLPMKRGFIFGSDSISSEITPNNHDALPLQLQQKKLSLRADPMEINPQSEKYRLPGARFDTVHRSPCRNTLRGLNARSPAVAPSRFGASPRQITLFARGKRRHGRSTAQQLQLLPMHVKTVHRGQCPRKFRLQLHQLRRSRHPGAGQFADRHCVANQCA